MDHSWSQSVMPYAGRIMTGVAALIALIFLGNTYIEMVKVNVDTSAALPVLAIGGVVVLVLLLTVVAMVFSILGLAVNNQAMGLPEGSIRAVIALSLIVLFAILSVYLYQGVSTGATLNKISNLTQADAEAFVKNHPEARGVKAELSKEDGKNIPIKDAAGTALVGTDNVPRFYYTVSYYTPNAASDAFAKDLLANLFTLMTAITSFYLGAGTATKASKGGSDDDADKKGNGTTDGNAPTLKGIKPGSIAIPADGEPVELELTGTNLGKDTNVSIARQGSQPIAGTDVTPTASGTITFKIAAVAGMEGAAWDVTVKNSGGKSATLAGKLAFTK